MLRARVHHMFLDAPRSVQSALVRYVAHSDPAASERIGRFIELNGGRLAPRSRKVPLHTLGKRHDLLAIFHDLNHRYFNGSMHALITWGKRTRREPRQTIKLGSYAAGDRLIRIHPALDRNWVPKYFVQFVVYHEMLHHIFPRAVATAVAVSCIRRTFAIAKGSFAITSARFVGKDHIWRVCFGRSLQRKIEL